MMTFLRALRCYFLHKRFHTVERNGDWEHWFCKRCFGEWVQPRY